ncbi:FeoA family protein [Hymenobacter baengnokdamensis]|uniref:FeoA family protein n=1 Tax=Hymenobacter baengnokdamensis TaxID=2615203 RepID=UPI001E3C1C83|nr:FeoA family protein [Hymenobacter baengnokdamensis]
MAIFRRSTAVAAPQPASGRRTANDLRPGESATVCCLKDPQMALKLLDMGCIPGTQVRLAGRAPSATRSCWCSEMKSTRCRCA